MAMSVRKIETMHPIAAVVDEIVAALSIEKKWRESLRIGRHRPQLVAPSQWPPTSEQRSRRLRTNRRRNRPGRPSS